MNALAQGIGTFARGVHPADRKELAADAAIEVLPNPKEVRIPLLQHLGAPCEASVQPKAEVALGDPVGTAKGFVSAPVHASLAGTAGRPGVCTLPNGRHVPVIPITAAATQPFADRALFEEIFGGGWPKDDFGGYEPKAIADAAVKAGLVGLGGAAFPTHVKLARNEKKPIDILLINGAECEPYLAADYRLMIEAPAPIITGALLGQRATGAKEVIVCIEDNKPKAAEAMRQAAQGTSVEVRILKTKYPQGGEKQLIPAVTGRIVPTGGLPLDIGVVVMNVGTAAALARAVIRGKPLTHRIVSVSGDGIKTPKNLLVPIGVSYQELIDCCGGLTADAARVISGGPMMGFTVGNPAETPVTKGTSGVTVLTRADLNSAAETACLKCGRCVDVCPLKLVPTRLALAGRANDARLATRYYANACMECGCCAYICPAGIPLVQLIRLSKLVLRNAANPKKV